MTKPRVAISGSGLESNRWSRPVNLLTNAGPNGELIDYGQKTSGRIRGGHSQRLHVRRLRVLRYPEDRRRNRRDRPQ
jgi:hypothetical protein